jgi:hypothetical protein
MPSGETLKCKECGQPFDTIESLREHARTGKAGNREPEQGVL